MSMGGVNQYFFGQNEVDFQGNNITDVGSIEFLNDAVLISANRTYIDNHNNALIYNVDLGETHLWTANAVSLMSLNLTGLDMFVHAINNASHIQVRDTELGNFPLSGAVRLVDVAALVWNNAAETLEGAIYSDNLILNFEGFSDLVTDITGDIGFINANTITASSAQILATSAQLTGFIELEEILTPATPGGQFGKLYVKDVSTISHLFFMDNLGTETDLLLGGSQTPWTSDIDAARFNLTNTGAIDFSLAGALVVPASTQPYLTYAIAPVPDAMILNVPLAREFQITIGAVEEYTFTNAVFDANGNSIDNVSLLTSNAASPATLGVIRLGNAEELTWRNSTNTANHSIYFNASNQFQIEITNGADYTFSETEFNVSDNNIINVNNLTLKANIIFGTSGVLPAGGTASIWWDGSTFMGFNVPNADEFRLYVNAVEQYSFSATVFDVQSNNVSNVAALGFNSAGVTLGIAVAQIFADAAGMKLNVPTGDTFIMSFNGSTRYTFGTNDVTFLNRDLLQVGNINFGSGAIPAGATPSIWSDGTTHVGVNVPTGDEFRVYINGIEAYSMNNTIMDFITGKTIQNLHNIQGIEGITFDDDATQLAGQSYIQRSNAHLILNSPTGDDIELGINDLPELTIALNQITINPATNLLAGGDVTISDRLQENKGPDVASATTITVGDGNFFDITGSGTINHMTFTGWQNGSMVTLQFDAAATTNHNTGTNPANTVSFFLAGSVNQTWTAGSTLTVVYDGVVWREVARSLA